MPTRLIDWTVRMVMLVLAGLVTLSILGSIAAISNQSGGFVIDRRERPVADPPTDPDDDRAETKSSGTPPPPAAAPAAGPGVSRAAGDPGQPGEAATDGAPDQRLVWLEAIAYALLALAGLIALAILLLWRGLRQLARIAEALQTRTRNE